MVTACLGATALPYGLQCHAAIVVILMELQKTLDSKTILSKKNGAGGNYHSIHQDTLHSHGNKDNMVPAQKHICGPMEQKRTLTHSPHNFSPFNI